MGLSEHTADCEHMTIVGDVLMWELGPEAWIGIGGLAVGVVFGVPAWLENQRNARRDREERSAELDIRFLIASEAGQSFTFLIHNSGQRPAESVRVVYRDGDAREVLLPGTTLKPGQKITPTSSLGAL